jgi:hypothetical protein
MNPTPARPAFPVAQAQMGQQAFQMLQGQQAKQVYQPNPLLYWYWLAQRAHQAV